MTWLSFLDSLVIWLVVSPVVLSVTCRSRTPKITTRKFTPICGAASPTPFNACMVSRISASKARSSSLPKPLTGSARCNNRASPMRNTGLTAIATHHAFKDAAHPLHRCARGGVDLFHVDALQVVAAPRSIIHDHGDGGILQFQLHRQRGFRHAGHADHVRTVALVAVDFRDAVQARPLRRGIHAA